MCDEEIEPVERVSVSNSDQLVKDERESKKTRPKCQLVSENLACVTTKTFTS